MCYHQTALLMNHALLDVPSSLFHDKWQDYKGCKADSLVSSVLTQSQKLVLRLV
jgi:hypothetical protein